MPSPLDQMLATISAPPPASAWQGSSPLDVILKNAPPPEQFYARDMGQMDQEAQEKQARDRAEAAHAAVQRHTQRLARRLPRPDEQDPWELGALRQSLQKQGLAPAEAERAAQQVPKLGDEWRRMAHLASRTQAYYEDFQSRGEGAWRHAVEMTPFGGAATNVTEDLRARGAAGRIRDGTATREDYDWMGEYLGRQKHQGEAEGWDSVGYTARGLIPFLGELYLSGGLGEGITGAIKAAIKVPSLAPRIAAGYAVPQVGADRIGPDPSLLGAAGKGLAQGTLEAGVMKGVGKLFEPAEGAVGQRLGLGGYLSSPVRGAAAGQAFMRTADAARSALPWTPEFEKTVTGQLMSGDLDQIKSALKHVGTEAALFGALGAAHSVGGFIAGKSPGAAERYDYWLKLTGNPDQALEQMRIEFPQFYREYQERARQATAEFARQRGMFDKPGQAALEGKLETVLPDPPETANPPPEPSPQPPEPPPAPPAPEVAPQAEPGVLPGGLAGSPEGTLESSREPEPPLKEMMRRGQTEQGANAAIENIKKRVTKLYGDGGLDAVKAKYPEKGPADAYARAYGDYLESVTKGAEGEMTPLSEGLEGKPAEPLPRGPFGSKAVEEAGKAGPQSLEDFKAEEEGVNAAEDPYGGMEPPDEEDGTPGKWQVMAGKRHRNFGAEGVKAEGVYSEHDSEAEAHAAMMKAKQDLAHTGFFWRVRHNAPEAGKPAESPVAPKAPDGWGSVEQGKEYSEPIASLPDAELTRRRARDPLPPPKATGVEPVKFQGAWDAVSRLWPEVAGKVREIRPLPPGREGEFGPHNAASNPTDGILYVDAERGITPESLWHELVHFEQKSRGLKMSRDSMNPDEFNEVESEARQRSAAARPLLKAPEAPEARTASLAKEHGLPEGLVEDLEAVHDPNTKKIVARLEEMHGGAPEAPPEAAQPGEGPKLNADPKSLPGGHTDVLDHLDRNDVAGNPAKLTETEKAVLRERLTFGTPGDEVADALGLKSRQRVAQVEKKAMGKLGYGFSVDELHLSDQGNQMMGRVLSGEEVRVQDLHEQDPTERLHGSTINRLGELDEQLDSLLRQKAKEKKSGKLTPDREAHYRAKAAELRAAIEGSQNAAISGQGEPAEAAPVQEDAANPQSPGRLERGAGGEPVHDARGGEPSPEHARITDVGEAEAEEEAAVQGLKDAVTQDTGDIAARGGDPAPVRRAAEQVVQGGPEALVDPPAPAATAGDGQGEPAAAPGQAEPAGGVVEQRAQNTYDDLRKSGFSEKAALQAAHERYAPHGLDKDWAPAGEAAGRPVEEAPQWRDGTPSQRRVIEKHVEDMKKGGMSEAEAVEWLQGQNPDPTDYIREMGVPDDPPSQPKAAGPKGQQMYAGGRPGTPGEGELGPIPEATGLAHGVGAAERAVAGREALRSLSVSDPQVYDAAQKRLLDDPNAGRDLVDALERDPARNPNAVETVLLLHEKVARELAYERARQAKSDAVRDKKPPEEIDRLSAEGDKAWDAIDQLEKAAWRVGSEAGRAFRLRRLLMARDYSLAGMLGELSRIHGKDVHPDSPLGQEVAKIADDIKRADAEQKQSGDALRQKAEELKQAKEGKGGDYTWEEVNALNKYVNELRQKHLDRLARSERAKAAWKVRRARSQDQVLPATSRVANMLQKLYVNFLISRPTVLGKLALSALGRVVSTPLEEAAGWGWSLLPPFSEISAGAPREGGRLADILRGEGKGAYGFLQGVVRALHGKSTGEAADVTRGVLDYQFKFHDLMKEPAVHAEFERSMSRRLSAAEREGRNINSDDVLEDIKQAAKSDAMRVKFRQENSVVTKLNKLLEVNKDTPWGWAVAKRLGRVAMPITRIPTNLATELGNVLFGAPIGLTRAGVAWRRGLKSLTPEQNDSIMRNMKKGSWGVALALLGWYKPELFGGFFQKDDRKRGDLKPMETGRPGMLPSAVSETGAIPGWALHNPMFQAAQAGATLKKAWERNASALQKGNTTAEGAAEDSAMRALFGYLEEYPMVKEGGILGGIVTDPRERGYQIGRMLKGMLVPGALQDAAQALDKDPAGRPITRKERSISEHVQGAIPWWRQLLPVDAKKQTRQPRVGAK